MVKMLHSSTFDGEISSVEYEAIIQDPFMLAVYSSILLFGGTFTAMLFFRWYQRRVEIAKWIACAYASFFIAVVNVFTGYLHAYVTGYKYPVYSVTLGLAYAFAMLSVSFLLLFAREIFGYSRQAPGCRCTAIAAPMIAPVRSPCKSGISHSCFLAFLSGPFVVPC